MEAPQTACGQCKRSISFRRLDTRFSRSMSGSPLSSDCSRFKSASKAASTAFLPRSVRVTKTTRRSVGDGPRLTRPLASSPSTRLVIVPLVTIVCLSSCPGVKEYGAPSRRNAAKTSNSQGSMEEELNASRRTRSISRETRLIRLKTSTGARSRSARSVRQACTISSTSSAAMQTA